MASATLNDTQNLYSNYFLTNSSYGLWVMVLSRSVDFRPRKGLEWSKHGPVRTLWRPQHHVLNKLEGTIYEKDVAHDVKIKLCHDDNNAKDLPASWRSRACCYQRWRESSLFLLTVWVALGIGSPGEKGQPVWESVLIFEPSGTHATPLENRME